MICRITKFGDTYAACLLWGEATMMRSAPSLPEAIALCQEWSRNATGTAIAVDAIELCPTCWQELYPDADIGMLVDKLEKSFQALPKRAAVARAGTEYTLGSALSKFVDDCYALLPSILQAFREQAMLLHDLQEESQAAREVMRLREVVKELEARQTCATCEGSGWQGSLAGGQPCPACNPPRPSTSLLDGRIFGPGRFTSEETT